MLLRGYVRHQSHETCLMWQKILRSSLRHIVTSFFVHKRTFCTNLAGKYRESAINNKSVKMTNVLKINFNGNSMNSGIELIYKGYTYESRLSFCYHLFHGYWIRIQSAHQVLWSEWYACVAVVSNVINNLTIFSSSLNFDTRLFVV